MSNMALPPPPPPSTEQSVAAEIEAELTGQIAPLEQEAAGYARAETRALQDLASLFGGIMPFVQGSAQRVAQMYGATGQAQTGVFNQAYQRLNALRQQRAGEAQALSQQLGAPIPLSAFTDATDIEMSAAAPEFAGDLLQSQGIAQAGVQQAEAFAGRVFPLQRVRLERETRNYYRDKISDLKHQIAAIKGMKKGMINERLRTRLLEDYQLKLARAQEAFDRNEALFQRKATTRQLNQQQRTIELEERRQREAERAARVGEGFERERIDLTKKQQAKGDRSYVQGQKANITAAANAYASGTTKTIKVRKQAWLENPKTGELTLDKYMVDKDISGGKISNPTALLNAIISATGIRPNQKELYNYAVQQVKDTLRARGIKVPDNQSEWRKWWQDRQDRLRRNARAGQRGTGGLRNYPR